MFEIIINGKKETLDKNFNIAELLKEKNIRQEVVTVELNDNIVERKDYSLVIIKEGDRLELVYFMGGGQVNHPQCGFGVNFNLVFYPKPALAAG